MKRLFVVLSALGLLLVGGGVAAGALMTPSTNSISKSGDLICRTNSNGYCEVHVPFAVSSTTVPKAVHVDLIGPNGGQPNLPYQHAIARVTTFEATTDITIRWLTQLGRVYVGPVHFYITYLQ